MSTNPPEIHADIVDPVLGNAKDTIEETESSLKDGVNKAASKVEDATSKSTKEKLDDGLNSIKNKTNDNLNKLSSKLDDLKDDLPKEEKKLINWFKSIYNSIYSNSTSLLKKTELKSKEFPTIASQLIIGGVLLIGVVGTYTYDPKAFERTYYEKKAQGIFGPLITTFAVLDGALIAYLNKEKL
ncbi:hypothetical protein CANARDRAFT_29129, partial [[Candida] arabinofermentans NRRL YB-2248]